MKSSRLLMCCLNCFASFYENISYYCGFNDKEKVKKKKPFYIQKFKHLATLFQ